MLLARRVSTRKQRPPQGDEVLVGSRAFLVDQGVRNSLPVLGRTQGSASQVFVARQGKVLASTA